MGALRLSGYEVSHVLHTSVATIVCKAVRLRDGERVVLKLPQADHPSLGEVARYRNQYELQAAMAGAGVVRTLGLEHIDHRPVLVSADTDCVTLAEHFATAPCSVDALLPLAIGLARALAAIHEAGIIHKDINPNNVVLERASGEVKLIDLGISTRLSHEAQGMAHPDVLEGTLLFMSPEQTGRMNCAVDARSDLYSTGVTLYALLAGRPPFDSDDPVALVHAHIAIEARPLGELVPDLPPLFGSIVGKLMNKSMDRRYQTARGLLKDLERAQAELLKHGRMEPFALGAGDLVARLDISHKLYGRGRELAALLGAFERVACGNAELLLVGGYSGIGKSALVHEVQKPIVARRGYFAGGKYDQYNRNVPYSALSAAFTDLVHYMLMEPAVRVAQQRAAILAAVGPYARLLIDVVPALELLLGPPEPSPPVAQAEQKSRFNKTFCAFVSTLARTEHPLVLFLDDVQWADTPSLHLLAAMLGQAQNAALLVIAAYRDNEVDAAHPAMLMAEEVKKSDTPVAKLALGPLAVADTSQFVADSLRVDPSVATPLAELLHGRTGGNPFFLVQLLYSLEHERLLSPSADGESWQWDLTQIRERGLTDDVISLMTARLRELPPETQTLLKLAACLGNRFDLELLSAAHGRPFEDTQRELWPALAEELVVPSEALRRKSPKRRSQFRFLHDRVQQAAYALWDADERAKAHYRLGWLLLRTLSGDQVESAIFDVVGHLNHGLSTVSEVQEREQIARLNVRAGMRAKAASAHRAAAGCFSTAMSLFGAEIWQADFPLAYELHCARAECEYLIGNFDTADSLAIAASAHSCTTLERARLYSIRVSIHITQANFGMATEVGLEAIRLFGHDVPADPNRAAKACAERAAELQVALCGIDGPAIQALVMRPRMSDPELKALMELLMDVWCATFFSGNAAVNSYAVNSLLCLSLAHGNAAESAFAYVLHGVMLMGSGDPRRAYQFGLLGMRVNEMLPNPVVTVRISNMFANCINPYFNHLETNLEHYRRSYEIGPRVGEIIYTVWAVNFILLLRTMKGDPLGEVYDESLPFLGFIRQTNDQAILATSVMQLQMIRALRGLTPLRNTLDEGDFSEQAALARHRESKFWPGLLFYGAYRSGVHVVFRDFRAALAASAIAEEALASDMGFWTSTNHFFYQSLALAGVYADTPESERGALLLKLEANLGKIATWAETGPTNFAHRRDLVAAELARCRGEGDLAARLYDASIASAKSGRFSNDVALAAEAACHFHRARGSDLAARAYLVEAHYAYVRWGADAKVSELRAEYPELCGATLNSAGSVAANSTTTLSAYGTTHGHSNALDYRTAMKAAQALSGEIDRHALIDKLLHLAMENAGAREAWLVLANGEALELVATSAVHAAPERLGAPVALASVCTLPVSVVQFVARTASPVVLRDAGREGRFHEDAQVVSLGCRSVACVPLMRQRRLTGVLYVENKLIEGAFAAERVEMLQLIAAQAAISLENAALYANLEARVAERTAALDAQNARMRLVLDNAEQGFLLASAQGKLDGQHSRIVETWFGAPVISAHVWDYLYPDDEAHAGTMEVCWQMLTEGIMPMDLCVEQLRSRFMRDGRTYDTAFRPILDPHGSVERVVVVITDITAALVAERAESAKQELADLLDRALADRSGFKEFLDEGRRLVSEIGALYDVDTTRHHIHTLKGNAALWQLKSLASLCHAVEDEHAETGDPVTARQASAIARAFHEATSKVESLISRDSDELSVRNADYDLLVEALSARRPYAELDALLAGFTKEPLARRFERFAFAAKAIADRLGKPGLCVRIEAEDLRTTPVQFAVLWASFTHLIRNAVDHGIEPPEARLAVGKPRAGQLTFRAYARGESAVVVELRDDGRGIDWAALARKARTHGLPAETDADLLDALFADGVSTRDQATELSGRGIGLAAVRAAARALGASIRVHSEPGLGTSFVFELPSGLFQRPRPSRVSRDSQRPSQLAPPY